jgi:hypothetical protein
MQMESQQWSLKRYWRQTGNFEVDVVLVLIGRYPKILAWNKIRSLWIKKGRVVTNAELMCHLFGLSEM